jgi:hypothetical protein
MIFTMQCYVCYITNNTSTYRDIIGDISAVKHIPDVQQLRFTGCKRLTGDVSCFLVPPPPPLPPTFQRKKSKCLAKIIIVKTSLLENIQ